jgi:type I restriction enzyme S subunit
MQGSAGSLSPRVKWEHLKNYEFSLPPLAEQKVLADKLWAAYRLKESYKKLLATTEEMVKSQFIEMFGDPFDGWKYPTKRLGEVYNIGTGGTPDRKVSGYYEGHIPWVKSTEVNYCELFDTEEHISDQALKNSNCSIYPSGTILLAMYGQGTTRGRVAQLRTDAAVNQAIAAIQVQDETESLFLYSMLKVCYDYVRNLAVGGNQHNLNLKLVSSIPIVIPPKELQQKFVSIAHQADKSGFELRKSIDAIDAVIKSLINS